MLRVLLAAAEIACHCHVARLTSAYRHRRGSDSQLTRTATHSHCAIRATTATNFPFPTLPQQRTVLPPPGAVTLAASSTRTAPLAQTTALSWQVNVGRTRGSLPCVCMLGCPPPPGVAHEAPTCLPTAAAGHPRRNWLLRTHAPQLSALHWLRAILRICSPPDGRRCSGRSSGRPVVAHLV